MENKAGNLDEFTHRLCDKKDTRTKGDISWYIKQICGPTRINYEEDKTIAEVILKSKLDEYEKVCEEDEIIENELKTNKENSTMII